MLEKVLGERKAKFDQTAFFTRLLKYLATEAPINFANSVTMSRIARVTAVPRATLYYYFGASVEKLLCEALRSGARAILQVNGSREYRNYPDLVAYVSAQMDCGFNLTQLHPWALPLYFRFRHAPGALGLAVREVEEAHMREQMEALKHFGVDVRNLPHARAMIRLRVSSVYSVSDAGLEPAKAHLILSELARTICASFSQENSRSNS